MLRRQVMQGPKRLGDMKKGVGQLEQPFEKHHVHGCSNHTERRVFGVGNTRCTPFTLSCSGVKIRGKIKVFDLPT